MKIFFWGRREKGNFYFEFIKNSLKTHSHEQHSALRGTGAREAHHGRVPNMDCTVASLPCVKNKIRQPHSLTR